MQKKILQIIHFLIFSDFWIFSQIFPSPEVKGREWIACKHGIYELPNELANDLRLMTLGN